MKNFNEEIKKRNDFFVSLEFSGIMVKTNHFLSDLFRRINAFGTN